MPAVTTPKNIRTNFRFIMPFSITPSGKLKPAIAIIKANAVPIGIPFWNNATAIGVYNFAVGLVYLPASIIAGYLWKLNPNYAFGFAALVAVAAFVFFVRGRQ